GNTATVTVNVQPPDIAITNFYSDGTNLNLNYAVSGADVGPFSIALYASHDGVSLDQQLQLVDAGVDPGAPGNHPLTFQPRFDDPSEDYRLLAVLDTDDDVTESNEDNNWVQFAGGMYVAIEDSGKRVLHVHGTNLPDNVILSVSGSTLHV